MRATFVVLIAISALVIAETYPAVCDARPKKAKAKAPKADAAIAEDPYAADAKADDKAAADKPKTDAEAAAAALQGEGGIEGGGAPGSILQQGEAGAGGEAGSVRRSNRMEFDERLVKGQAAKSGAVYLFERAPRRLPGLVPMRRSYRKRIVEPVLGERVLKPAVYSEKPLPEPAVEPEAEKPPAEKPDAGKPAEPEGGKKPVEDKPKG